MSRQSKGGVREKIIEKTKITEPRMWKVVFLNDDVTPILFVIRVMIKVFDKPVREAEILTYKIHNEGIGIVGVYPKSIAEAKKKQADEMLKAQNLPLAIKLERE